MKRLLFIKLIIFSFLQIFISPVLGSTILQMNFDNTLQDSSGNGFDGQWHGNESYAPGYDGSAINLSADNDDYVIIEHQDSLSGMSK